MSVVVRALICRHGRRDVIRGVSFNLEPGERVALIGANGAGKSTLLRTLLGLHPVASGLVELGGRKLVPHRRPHAGTEIAWIPQERTGGSFPLPAHELLASSGNAEAARAIARRLEVGDLLSRPLHTLSGGQLQRMFLARALGQVAAGAGLLLADEPDAALDFDGQEQIADLLQGLPATVLVATHSPSLARQCHRTLEMASGRLRDVA